MNSLNSPGTLVTITDETYTSSSTTTGTVPLILIATAENKLQPGSTTAIAQGTLPANDGVVWDIGSQGELINTFGNPKFTMSGGSSVYNSELNEWGLHAAYEYLGIGNSVKVLRANIDLSSLQATTVVPSGNAAVGTYWLDLNSTSYGLFESAGNSNPNYTWASQTPNVISSSTNLELVVQGYASNIISNSSDNVLSTNETVAVQLTINGVSLELYGSKATVGTPDSLLSIVNKINDNAALNNQGIVAYTYARQGKYTPNGEIFQGSLYGDIFNIRITSNNIQNTIDLTGSTPSVLSDLGLNVLPTAVIAPAHNYGSDGSFAIDSVSMSDVGSGMAQTNAMWQKIPLVTSNATESWWVKVGSLEENMPGWSWQAAVPNSILGTVSNPVFNGGESFQIGVGDELVTITVPQGGGLSNVVSSINSTLSSLNNIGCNIVASIKTINNQQFLQLVNYDATNFWLHDNATITGFPCPLANAGISTSQNYFGSVTGSNTAPTFNPPTLGVETANVVTAGSGYVVGSNISLVGGTGTSANLTIESIQAVSANVVVAGSGFEVGDLITISGTGYTTPVGLVVSQVGDTGIVEALSINTTTWPASNPGQYTGSANPTNPISTYTVSRAGSIIESATGLTFSIEWGISTVSLVNVGSYSSFPTNPVSVTSQNGTGAQLNLTPFDIVGDAFSIDYGTGPVVVSIPAYPNNTLQGVINAINQACGPKISASMTNGALTITNTNGTGFFVKDISGTPLNSAGIECGYVYGRMVTFFGYASNLTAPSQPNQIAANNIWINTTPAYNGASYVIYKLVGSNWIEQNTNTGSVPMFSNDQIANAAFGQNRTTGSLYARYNPTGDSTVSTTIFMWNSNSWQPLAYTSSITTPTGAPVNGTLWYNTNLQVDIMVGNGKTWMGYRNVYPATDINGVIIDGSQPTTQSTGAPLVDYDLWLDSSNPSYPTLYRYDAYTGSFVLINNTDHSSSAGIIFADARFSSTGSNTLESTQAAMVLSNVVDSDAPNAELFPSGMLLFNTRYSTNNVKKWNSNYFANGSGAWVSASGSSPSGVAYFGNQAQRNMIVESLNGALASNEEIRSEFSYYNLITAPGYIECLSEMIQLNEDKNYIATIIGDIPMRLAADTTSITNWATNANNAPLTGPEGLTISDNFTCLYYGWGLGTNVDGTTVFIPSSTIGLMTIGYNDTVAYPWNAPAGTERGIVSVVTSIGYLDENNNDTYVPVKLSRASRDALYENNINPIAQFPSYGLVVWGQKTLCPTSSSALTRVNVARLVNYLQYQLDLLSKPYMFQQNLASTRASVTATYTSFFNNLVTLGAVYDYGVLCDDSNNTPLVVDQEQLWIDIAFSAARDIEFIYIPVRIVNSSADIPNGYSS